MVSHSKFQAAKCVAAQTTLISKLSVLSIEFSADAAVFFFQYAEHDLVSNIIVMGSSACLCFSFSKFHSFMLSSSARKPVQRCTSQFQENRDDVAVFLLSSVLGADTQLDGRRITAR